MNLDGRTIKKIQDALVSGYPQMAALRQMVRIQLDVNLAEIVADGNLRDVVFDLIVWAESSGRVQELAIKAKEHNPKNPLLRELPDEITHFQKPISNSLDNGKDNLGEAIAGESWQLNFAFRMWELNIAITKGAPQGAYSVGETREVHGEKENEENKKKKSEKILESVINFFEDAESNQQIFQFAPDTGKQFAKLKQKPMAEQLFGYQKSMNEGDKLKPNRSPALQKKTPSYMLETDSLARAAIAGFWYLKYEQPRKAKEAFESIKKCSDLGQELFALVGILDKLMEPSYKEIPDAPLDIENERPEMRRFKETWDAFEMIREFARCGWIYQRCHEKERRQFVGSLAIEYLEKAKEKLTTVVGNDSFSPIEDILSAQVDHWLKQMAILQQPDNSWTPKIEELKAIDNPFMHIEPIRGGGDMAYHKRKDVEGAFKKAWVAGNFQPLLIYGQRQIGKTSVIFPHTTKDDKEKVVIYINLRHLDADATFVNLLKAICNGIANEDLPLPDDTALYRTPYFTFGDHITKACRYLAPKALVIAIDEFEHIESLWVYNNTYDSVLHYLWELSQVVKQLGFVFMTHKTRDEILQQYDNPFATGLSPIHISYMDKEAVHGLLRTPTDSFLPYIDDEAIRYIQYWTAGHPYLVQLWGHCLVNKLNAERKKRDPLFTVDKVTEVRTTEDFQQGLRHYATNIWREVAYANRSCASVLYQLSRSRARLGLPIAALTTTGSTSSTCQALEIHDVIFEDTNTNRWKITVPLLRNWFHRTMKPDGSLPDSPFSNSAAP